MMRWLCLIWICVLAAACSREKGTGAVPADEVKRLTRVATLSDVDAQVKLGIYFSEGRIGGKTNTEQAIFWWKRAASLGNNEAKFRLGKLYYDGFDENPRYINDLTNLWFTAAMDGHARAQHGVALLYMRGRGVPKDERQAVEWFKKAAAGGDLEAEVSLGTAHFSGFGTETNTQQALACFSNAAQKGSARGQFFLGMLFRDGIGVPQDRKEAFKWLERAANQKNREAQFELGMCYLRGLGVQANEHQAVKLFVRAAEQDVNEAQLAAAIGYLNGKGIRRDPRKGGFWLMRAASHGNKKAQELLATCYARGVGVTADHAEACKWLILSEQGDLSQFVQKENISALDRDEGKRRAEEELEVINRRNTQHSRQKRPFDSI